MCASIIIASHQEGDLLYKTVDSCVETCAGLDCEIIVSDDASTDGSIDRVAKHWPQVRVIRHETRQGASPAKASGASSIGETCSSFSTAIRSPSKTPSGV